MAGRTPETCGLLYQIMGFDLITKKSFVQGCEDHPIHHLPYVRFSACLLAWCAVKTQMEAGGQTRESVCIIAATSLADPKGK